ncbi:CaiB/BaiF CoA transferase family protein [Variovorax guangxiensis]|uniref:CoA transferase n=1 Tax=Variovorax guangxiensis TaxID=1775474 RepID=A0A502DKT2_9BURK|nr:CoA transferase [Variovorax guangxiensis]TPG22157.1 CoA transferase [Variovorax ginsengisoli]TPG26045.1 CoA transferase [Variovorax guangxiensis]
MSISNESQVVGPCHGIRVIEFAAMVAGPYCGQMLADMGAEVIKVEGIEGDGLRAVRPHHAGLGALFAQNNRGKKSISLDMKSPEGLAICQDLVRSADVVLENFRPGVMKRLGLDYESVRSLAPEVIYASVTGFGESGPYVGRPAYDQVLQAMTGNMWTQGEERVPEPVRNAVVDKIAAVTVCNGILAALLHRARTGEGQKVSVSLLDAYSAFMIPGLDTHNRTFVGAGLPHYPARPIFRAVSAKDGYVMGYIHTNAHWEGCARAFRREDLISDSRFSSPSERLTNVAAMWSEMEKGAQNLTTAEIMEVAVANSVPMSRVNTVDELMADPQAIHNEVFVDYQDEVVGTLRTLNFPIRFGKTPANVNARAPLKGEHTEQVLSTLGVQAERIEGLRTDGRVLQGP